MVGFWIRFCFLGWKIFLAGYPDIVLFLYILFIVIETLREEGGGYGGMSEGRRLGTSQSSDCILE